MSKHRPAYERYLNTGNITDIWGVTRPGSGPPSKPMTQDEFYAVIRKYPKPEGNRPVNREPWSDELVKRTMWSNPKITNLAAEQGWILGLHDLIRDKHRLPKNHEFDKLRRNAAFVRECAAGREDLPADKQRLAQSLLDKRHRLTEEFAR